MIKISTVKMVLVCAWAALTGQFVQASYFGRMAQATRIGRFLEKTRERRANMSTALGYFGGVTYVGCYSADTINEVRRYNANDPKAEKILSIDPLGYQVIGKVSECGVSIGAALIATACVTRFPLTASLCLGIMTGAQMYHEKVDRAFHREFFAQLQRKLKELKGE